jgi:DNA-binding GntR family transcriptional regulator
MLEAEGLVTYVHNVGAQVSFPDPHLYRNTMETLGLVEGYATALSAPKITPEELERAAAINEEMRKLAAAASFDPTAFTDANHRFHDILHAHCDNDHISDLVRRGWGRLEAMRESSFGLVPNRAAESVAEHDQLVDLIRDGAPAAEIERAAREHRLRTMRAVLEQQGDANA